MLGERTVGSVPDCQTSWPEIAVLAVRFVSGGLGSTRKIDVAASALLAPAAAGENHRGECDQLDDPGLRQNGDPPST